MLLMIGIGLALFLFGMAQLEAGIRALGLRTFQRWLSRSTASPIASAGTGIAVTALLQSSSLVSLLVLAFASAGVLPLYNAIGILLGANLGTTFTGWVVATIGFKLSLQDLALPALGLGALLQLIHWQGERLAALGRILFGLGLIVFGLDIMKETMAGVAGGWDLGALSGYGVWVYFLAGTAIAALIQSSSATMMLTLAALNSGLLTLPAAAAIVIGADLGTTSTTVLASIGGSVVKRQLALAHLVFNLLVDIAALLVLLPLLPQLQAALGLADPLYMLVVFHSLFNLLGLAVFLPLLKPFAGWIAGRFAAPPSAAVALAGQPTAVPSAALVAIGRALTELRADTLALVLHYFHLQPDQLSLAPATAAPLLAAAAERLSPEERYSRIKATESALFAYSFDLQAEKLDKGQVDSLAIVSREARALAYSAKTLKDIRRDIVTMRHSELAPVKALYESHRDFLRDVLARYLDGSGRAGAIQTPSVELLADNESHYREVNAVVSELAAADTVSGTELSTLLNVNRDIHHAVKDLLIALG